MGNKTIFEWAEMLQEQIQNGASQSDTIQMLEDYKNQALRIHDVVGRSEQLKCHHQYMNAGTLQGDAMKKCLKCGDYVKAL